MPELLNAATRRQLERLNTDNLPERALVKRPPALVAGSGVATALNGDRTLTPATIYTDEPCRVGPAVPQDFTIGDQRVAAGQRIVSFTKGRDIKARDELTITLATGEVLQLSVVGLTTPHSYEIARVAICQRRGAA